MGAAAAGAVVVGHDGSIEVWVCAWDQGEEDGCGGRGGGGEGGAVFDYDEECEEGGADWVRMCVFGGL